jgi:hypothetical protein
MNEILKLIYLKLTQINNNLDELKELKKLEDSLTPDELRKELKLTKLIEERNAKKKN